MTIMLLSYFIMLVDGVENDEGGVAGDLELGIRNRGTVVYDNYDVL